MGPFTGLVYSPMSAQGFNPKKPKIIEAQTSAKTVNNQENKMNQTTTQSQNDQAIKSMDNKAEKVTSVEGITEYKLPNGLRF